MIKWAGRGTVSFGNVHKNFIFAYIRIFVASQDIDNHQKENQQMSRVMRKPALCICKNKADQLRGNHEADQRLCFRYINSTIPLLSKSEISNL